MSNATYNNLTKFNTAEAITVNAIVNGGRDAVINSLRIALKERTGRTWSVKGGRGTSYGWIEINAVPARCTMHYVPRDGAPAIPAPEDYIEVNTGERGGYMTREDRELLKEVMGLDSVHTQGISIPASSDYRRMYLHHAMYGNAGGFTAEPYWD